MRETERTCILYRGI